MEKTNSQNIIMIEKHITHADEVVQMNQFKLVKWMEGYVL